MSRPGFETRSLVRASSPAGLKPRPAARAGRPAASEHSVERGPRQRQHGAGRRRAASRATCRATRANGKNPFQLGSHDGNSASPLFPSMSPGARVFPSHPQPLPQTGLHRSGTGYTSARVGCCSPCSALRLRRRYHCYTGCRCRCCRHLHTTAALLPCGRCRCAAATTTAAAAAAAAAALRPKVLGGERS